MATHQHEMQIPPVAACDREAVEILRVWISGGNQHVTLKPGAWDDPAVWGMLLVDLARHVANAFEQTERMSTETALERIKVGFDAEWNSPTDAASGNLT